MAEEEESEFKRDLEKLVKGLIALCPAYNSATRILRDTGDKSIAHVSSAYPEIFDAKILPVLTSVFKFSVDLKAGVRVGLAYYLLNLIDELENLLDNKEVRKIISRCIGGEPPNPSRDYVEMCVDVLEKDAQIALKLLRVAAGVSYSADFNTLISKAKEHFGLELGKEELVEHLIKLDDLGLLSDFREDHISVKERYKRHIIDLAKI